MSRARFSSVSGCLLPVLLAAGLAGCAKAPAPAAPSMPEAAVAASQIDEDDYQTAPFKTLQKLGDTESMAFAKEVDGQRFKVKCQIAVNPPGSELEGWYVAMKDSAAPRTYMSVDHFASPLFLVWSQERERAWYEERGAYTGIGNVKNWRETVTVYFKAKATSNFHDRMDWDAVRRANGILVTI